MRTSRALKSCASSCAVKSRVKLTFFAIVMDALLLVMASFALIEHDTLASPVCFVDLPPFFSATTAVSCSDVNFFVLLGLACSPTFNCTAAQQLAAACSWNPSEPRGFWTSNGHVAFSNLIMIPILCLFFLNSVLVFVSSETDAFEECSVLFFALLFSISVAALVTSLVIQSLSTRVYEGMCSLKYTTQSIWTNITIITIVVCSLELLFFMVIVIKACLEKKSQTPTIGHNNSSSAQLAHRKTVTHDVD